MVLSFDIIIIIVFHINKNNIGSRNIFFLLSKSIERIHLTTNDLVWYLQQLVHMYLAGLLKK